MRRWEGGGEGRERKERNHTAVRSKLIESREEGIRTSTFVEAETLEIERWKKLLCAKHFIYILFALPSKELEVPKGAERLRSWG